MVYRLIKKHDRLQTLAAQRRLLLFQGGNSRVADTIAYRTYTDNRELT